jgi:hypothetical protein
MQLILMVLLAISRTIAVSDQQGLPKQNNRSVPPSKIAESILAGATKRLPSLASEGLEKAIGGWDSPIGSGLLRFASTALLRPTAKVVIEQVDHVDFRPDEVETTHLSGGPLASAEFNTTRLLIEGLDSLSAFPELFPSGSGRIDAASKFDMLDVRIWMDSRVRGPLGTQHDQRLLLSAKLSNVSLSLRWKCAVHPGALVAVLEGAALDRAMVDIDLDHVQVRVQSDVRVRLETIQIVESSSSSSSASTTRASPVTTVLWKLFNKALSSKLKLLVEEHAAAEIEKTLRKALSGNKGMDKRNSFSM